MRRDSLRFFDVSSASLSELGYGLHAATRLGYIDAQTLAAFEEKVRMVAGPLHGLIATYRLRGALIQAGGASARRPPASGAAHWGRAFGAW